MSDRKKFGEFRREPNRSWKAEDDHSGMRCYLGMEGRITIEDIFAHFAEHYPHVDPMKLELNFATATWDEPASPEDIEHRRKQRADYALRQEKWERETLERLTEKYGIPSGT